MGSTMPSTMSAVPEAGPQAQKQHLRVSPAAQALHGGIVDKLYATAVGASEIKDNSPTSQIYGIRNWTIPQHWLRKSGRDCIVLSLVTFFTPATICLAVNVGPEATSADRSRH